MAVKKQKTPSPPKFIVPQIGIEKLFDAVKTTLAQYPKFRAGQAIYNTYFHHVLSKQTLDIQVQFACYIRDNPKLDPFYNDDNIHEFIKLVTGRNDGNAWKVFFQQFTPSPTPEPLQKVYCGTCKYVSVNHHSLFGYTDEYRCKAIPTVRDTPIQQEIYRTSCEYANRNNDCNQYQPRKKFMHYADCATHRGPAEPPGPCNCRTWSYKLHHLLAPLLDFFRKK